ncbi:Starch-binding associating with outer membrane [bacterium A37T11]|nr:Starch-binding associating with outer membrane [bacterium A37T11]
MAVFIAFMFSCNALDIAPSDSIDPSKAFRNVKDLNMGLLGAYAVLDYTLIGVNSIVSDEANMPEENSVSNSDAYRWLYTASSGSVTSAFDEYYSAIDRANRVLGALDGVPAPNDNDAAIKNQYKGELLALRAYSHFEILRAYASAYENGAMGIPYMKESVISNPAREPFEEVITNIKADLSEAKNLVPTSFNDNSRITKNGISAIQARLALYEKNWADAINYSTEVIEAVPLASADEFQDIWTDESDSEVVWKLKRVSGDTRIGGFYFREAGGIVLYAPSYKLINTFDVVHDIRYTSYISHETDRGNGKAPYLVKKYRGGDLSAPGLTDIKLFRTGEMFLIRAEALAESSAAIVQSVDDLNTLRHARIDGYTDETISSKDALIQAIYTERYKELAFEGQRFFDLRRRNLPVKRSEADASNTSGALTLTPADAQYALPIPAQEISVNHNMKQNPNY